MRISPLIIISTLIIAHVIVLFVLPGYIQTESSFGYKKESIKTKENIQREVERDYFENVFHGPHNDDHDH